MKVKFYNKYPTNIDIDTDNDVDVYIDQFIENVPENIRIVMLEEPFKGYLYNLAKDFPEYYTHLLTFHEELKGEKTTIFNCVDCWIKCYGFPEKSFSVSTVVGGKSDSAMEGYLVRHELWRFKHLIKTPKRFFLSSRCSLGGVNYKENLVLMDSKEPLFDSMFHVAIENTSIKNYFSEKIVDCFQTKTVPIYYGCKNITDYFDERGILIADSLEEIIETCNNLTPELYESMKPFIEENYKRSMTWTNHDEQIKNAVIKLI